MADENTKTVIVLTKSKKNHNYCVAGVDAVSGQWIRIVSDDEDTGGALTEQDMTYENGKCCEILDCVKFPIIGPKPTEVQPENILINRAYPIEKVGEATLEDVLAIHPAENRKKIFGTDSGFISSENMGKYHVDYSLTLVKGENLIFHKVENKLYGRTKYRADFNFNGSTYIDMSVTDLEFRQFADEGAKFDQAYMVISLGEAFGKDGHEDDHYKFVAQIFRNPREPDEK